MNNTCRELCSVSGLTDRRVRCGPRNDARESSRCLPQTFCGLLLRRLNCEGDSFKNKIASAKGGVRFLKAIGFEPSTSGEAQMAMQHPANAELLSAAKAQLKESVRAFAHLQEQRRVAEQPQRISKGGPQRPYL